MEIVKNEYFDWQGFIDDCAKDENGRIIMSEEVKAEHRKELNIINKDYATQHGDYKMLTELIRFPKDENGHFIIPQVNKDRALRIVKWIDENHPNTNYMPFHAQDRIKELAIKALNLI